MKPGWEARLELAYACRDGRTAVSVPRRLGPLTVQKSFHPEGEVCHSVILHPPGGIAGGDLLALDVTGRTGAHALLTTPGAGKWYRSAGPRARQQVRIHLDDGAILEYLPQESIIFDGARGASELRVELRGGARFLGWDILALGRQACGEAYATGRFRQSLTVLRDGRPLVVERAAYDGGDLLLDSAAGLRGHRVLGTLCASGPGVAAALPAVRAVAPAAHARDWHAASAWGDVLVARYLGDCSARARRHFEALWSALRPAWLGLAAMPPRIWST